MKTLNQLFTTPFRFFLFCFFALLVGSFQAWSQSTEHGKITLLDVPEKSPVYLNDSIVASSDRHFSLPPGTYRISVNYPHPMDYRFLDYDTTVMLRSNQHLTLRCRFQRRMRIESVPSGAEIFLDSQRLGETPCWIDYAQPMQIRAVLKNQPPQELVINDSVFNAGTARILFPAGTVNTNLFKDTRWMRRGEKKYQWPLTVSLSLAIVSGGFSAYTKKKADRYFEKAKIAARFLDEEKRIAYEKKTKRYDRYAAIGFIGLQIHSLAAVYFIFKMN